MHPPRLPFLAWLTTYSKTDFGKDVLAGFALVAISIPQSMAYAVLAGLPAVFGLYAAAMPSAVYFFFGTCHHLSFGMVLVLF